MLPISSRTTNTKAQGIRQSTAVLRCFRGSLLAESSRNGLTNQGDKERPLPDLQKRSRHGVNRELGEGIKVAVAVDQAGSIAPLHDSLDALFARRRGHANPTAETNTHARTAHARTKVRAHGTNGKRVFFPFTHHFLKTCIITFTFSMFRASITGCVRTRFLCK